jgi:hypothetical protein
LRVSLPLVVVKKVVKKFACLLFASRGITTFREEKNPVGTSFVQAEHASAQVLHALPSRARGSRRAGSAGS